MKPMHHIVFASLAVAAMTAFAGPGDAQAPDGAVEKSKLVRAEKTSSGSTMAEAQAKAKPRPRAEVKAEAVKANKEHRATISESLDFMKK